MRVSQNGYGPGSRIFEVAGVFESASLERDGEMFSHTG